MTVPPPAQHQPAQQPMSAPQQPMSAPQQPMSAPQQPPKKPVYKRVWFWIVVGAGLLIVSGIGSAIGGGERDPAAGDGAGPIAVETEPAAEEPAEDPAPPVEEPAPVAAIGEPVTAGDWQVTVTGVGAPVASVGSQYFSTEAQGVFVPIAITALNNGSEAQMFFASNLRAIDDQGREFEYSSDAAIYAGDGGASMIDEVNPGNTLTGTLYYDVPDGATLVELQISGGLFDLPVTVRLR